MACSYPAHRHGPKASCLHFLAMVLAVIAPSSCSAHRSQHSVLQDGREIIHVEHGPDGVVWAVQLSDLHISPYYTDRGTSLQTLMGPLLALVSPSVVLITGDLTDAKSKDRKSRRQDEGEWVQYRHAIGKVIEDSGLPSYAFYDLRGNHDKFGVPMVGSALDYFSNYSVSSLRNRTSNVQSVTIMSSGWKHLFVGVDTSMGIGLKGPCNLFGHPTDEQLVTMDLALSQWDTCPPENVTKVVFGHFPMSFTASTEQRSRPESIFAKHSISAYVCGHLHKSFGPNLIKHYLRPQEGAGTPSKCKAEAQDGSGEFWEWEMGDWRSCRTMRIIAIDQGHTSFTDFDVSGLNASDRTSKNWLPTLVVPTYPLDSQKMERSTHLHSSASIQDTVRALVFSPQPLVSVVARFYDTRSGKPLFLEELEMHSTAKAGNMGYMFETKWNSKKYTDPSATRYVFRISAVDSTGTVTESSFRPFSVQRRVSEIKMTWREFSVMGFVWEDVFTALTWLAFAALCVFFILPKILLHFLSQNGHYQRWSFYLFRRGNQKLTVRRATELFIWFFLQGCSSKVLWWGQLLVVLWLIFLPWFWGQALAEGYSLGFMSLGGWMVTVSETLPPQSGLGWPDLMTIVLPYLYFVVLPLYTLIFALSAESSLHEIHQMEAPSSLKKKEQGVHIQGEMKSLLSSQGPAVCCDRDQQNGSDNSPVSNQSLGLMPGGCRRFRFLMMVVCAIISLVHFGQVCAVAGAYGVIAVLASPGFAWPVPVLMITAVLQSSACRKQ
eukprot:c24691_g1_i1 orf=231-2552(+)